MIGGPTSKVRIGDIFEVRLQNHKKGYIQYIANDQSQLNSDVIRVFKTHYLANQILNFEEVVKDEVEFYSHVTGVEFGVSDGSWVWVKNVSNIGARDNILFRDPGDPDEKKDNGNYGLPRVSKAWYVWKINGKRILVPELVGEDTKAQPGSVVWPKSIVHQMNTGEKMGFYPSYK